MSRWTIFRNIWNEKVPFDRLMLAQARIESATLISADGYFSRYPGVHVLW